MSVVVVVVNLLVVFCVQAAGSMILGRENATVLYPTDGSVLDQLSNPFYMPQKKTSLFVGQFILVCL